MAVITVWRLDVSLEEVSETLRQGLGPKYKVSPGSASKWGRQVNLQSERLDSILVERVRPLRADVTISRLSDRTELYVRASGLSPTVVLTNGLWIAPKVRRVLRSAPSLR